MGPNRACLRVALARRGRVHLDRWFSPGDEVSIGTSESCALVVNDADIGPKHTIFETRDDRWSIHLATSMRGRLEHQGVRRDVATHLGGRDASSTIELDPSSRGVLELGDTTLLFQLGERPPVRASRELGKTLRGGWLRNIDWMFTSFVVLSFAAHFGAIAVFENSDGPVVDPAFPVEIARLVMPEDQAPPPPPDVGANAMPNPAAPATNAPPAPPATPRDPTAERTPPAHPNTTHVDPALVAQATTRALALLSAFDEAHTGAVTDLLHDPGSIVHASDVLDQTSRVMVASNSSTLVNRDAASSSSSASTIDSLRIGTDLRARTEGDPIVEQRVSVRMPPPEHFGPGQPPSPPDDPTQELIRALHSHLRAMQMCYEHVLNQSPGLSGKVTAEFTVTGVGEVRDVQAVDNTSDSDALARCVTEPIARIRLTHGSISGPMTFSYPFVFAPMN